MHHLLTGLSVSGRLISFSAAGNVCHVTVASRCHVSCDLKAAHACLQRPALQTLNVLCTHERLVFATAHGQHRCSVINTLLSFAIATGLRAWRSHGRRRRQQPWRRRQSPAQPFRAAGGGRRGGGAVRCCVEVCVPEAWPHSLRSMPSMFSPHISPSQLSAHTALFPCRMLHHLSRPEQQDQRGGQRAGEEPPLPGGTSGGGEAAPASDCSSP